MTGNEAFTARVEQIAAGGAGLASVDGKKVFIDLTAPGDLVKGYIKKDHRFWAEAELLEILKPSPQRIKPLCVHYGVCGGCSLQHINYESQLEAKAVILTEAFERIGKVKPPEIKVKKSEPFEYRNRLQFHLSQGKSLCFKEKKSANLIAVTDCPVAEKGIRKAMREGKIPHPGGKERFTVFSKGDVFLVEGLQERGKISVLGKELTVDASVFFQSNVAMLEELLKDLITASSSADRNLPMADVYCGLGTFASFLGGFFTEIDLVEENKRAIAIAKENLYLNLSIGLNELRAVNYHAVSDSEWVKRGMGNKRWGFMVLDPPRNGLSAPLRERLAKQGPELIAYVSCDPATLARDSGVLLDGEYEMKELIMYDFYPQTAHIESLALFCRK